MISNYADSIWEVIVLHWYQCTRNLTYIMILFSMSETKLLPVLFKKTPQQSRMTKGKNLWDLYCLSLRLDVYLVLG